MSHLHEERDEVKSNHPEYVDQVQAFVQIMLLNSCVVKATSRIKSSPVTGVIKYLSRSLTGVQYILYCYHSGQNPAWGFC